MREPHYINIFRSIKVSD